MLYYSDLGAQTLAQTGDLHATFVAKSSGPVTTSTTGVYNAVYGAQAWAMMNQEANTFGVLPKVPWGRSGFRVKSARANSLPTAGVAETGAIPSTHIPDYVMISYKPKLAAHSFDNTEMQEFLVEEADDDMYASMAQLRNDLAIEHKEDINKMLNFKFTDGVATDKFESIDRVVSSSAEYGANGTLENIYGVTRSSSTWFNAQVLDNGGTARNISDALIRQLDRTIGAAGGHTTFAHTGWDTFAALAGMYESQVRYPTTGAPIGQVTVAPSVNGIQTKEGIAAGYRVSTLYGYPVILSKDVTVDTLSRLYFLDVSNPEGFDTPRLCIKIAKPTQYFEAGINQGTPFAINAFGNKGLYRTMGELHCPFPAAQGKLRDLK
jgi:hypothetical protein